MPFTLCHPALVVPLYRRTARFTSLSGLVIGSMAPDFPYFVPIPGLNGSLSHSWAGLLLYCVPAGLLLHLLYYALLRPGFLAWAPRVLASRMAPHPQVKPRDAREAVILLASLWLGAVSHIVWDGFTHWDSALVQHVYALQAPVAVGGAIVPVYKLLQHGSTLVGFLVLGWYVRAWAGRTAPRAVPARRLDRRRRELAAGAIAVAGMAGALAGLLHPAATLEHTLYYVAVTSVDCAAIVIVLLCLAWRAAFRPLS